MPTALIQADLYHQHNKETASAGGHPTETMAELNIKASEWKQKGQINFQSIDRLQEINHIRCPRFLIFLLTKVSKEKWETFHSLSLHSQHNQGQLYYLGQK